MTDEEVEVVARAILTAAGQLNDPTIWRDLDDAHINTTRLWSKRYARAAIVALDAFRKEEVG